MKNFLKSTIPAAALMIGMVSSQSAFAGQCNTAYATKVTKLDSPMMTNADKAAISTAAIAAVGLQATEVSMLSTIGSTVVTAGGASTSAVQAYRINQAKKAYRLLTEADLGQGLLLNEVAEKLNLTPQATAKIISEANNQGTFCSEADGLYTYGEILAFVSGVKK